MHAPSWRTNFRHVLKTALATWNVLTQTEPNVVAGFGHDDWRLGSEGEGLVSTSLSPDTSLRSYRRCFILPHVPKSLQKIRLAF